MKQDRLTQKASFIDIGRKAGVPAFVALLAAAFMPTASWARPDECPDGIASIFQKTFGEKFEKNPLAPSAHEHLLAQIDHWGKRADLVQSRITKLSEAFQSGTQASELFDHLDDEAVLDQDLDLLTVSLRSIMEAAGPQDPENLAPLRDRCQRLTQAFEALQRFSARKALGTSNWNRGVQSVRLALKASKEGYGALSEDEVKALRENIQAAETYPSRAQAIRSGESANSRPPAEVLKISRFHFLALGGISRWIIKDAPAKTPIKPEDIALEKVIFGDLERMEKAPDTLVEFFGYYGFGQLIALPPNEVFDLGLKLSRYIRMLKDYKALPENAHSQSKQGAANRTIDQLEMLRLQIAWWEAAAGQPRH